jgi:hypothetical protein
MIRSAVPVVLALALGLIASTSARAQQKGKAVAERPAEELVVKVYRVLGLVTPAPDYSYEGTYLPTMLEGRTRPSLSGYGGMGGGMMGGMGGGMFSVSDRLAQRITNPNAGVDGVGGGAAGGGGGGAIGHAAGGISARGVAAPRRPNTRIDMDRLIDAITSTIDPASWDEVGGEGTITPIGGSLAIRQTLAIHAKVKNFLDELQRESGTLQVLTVDAQWLFLTAPQLEQLHHNADGKKPVLAHFVSRQALGALPAETHAYSGHIACFNGQTVHIASGRLKTMLQGAVPVVGGNAPAYQPVVVTPHVGALLQVTPSVLPGNDGVMLDIHSSVTRLDQSEKPVELQGTGDADGKTVVQVDRMNARAQQLATSLRVPLGQPVLAGGMSFPGREATTQEGQLYLVVEVQGSQEP